MDVWLKEVEKHGKPDVEILIIANKHDLIAQGEAPEVSDSEIKEFE